MLKNLQRGVVLCFYMEHTSYRERQVQHFLWMIYGIYFRETPYQTTQAILQANDKLYEGVGLPTKNIRSSSEH